MKEACKQHAKAAPEPETYTLPVGYFSPVDHAVIDVLGKGRKWRSDKQVLLFLLVLNATAGAPRRRGTAPPKWSKSMTVRSIATRLGVSQREGELMIADAAQRGLILMQPGGRGSGHRFAVSAQSSWPEIPDYVPGPTRQLDPEPEPDEPEPQPVSAERAVVAPGERGSVKISPSAVKPDTLTTVNRTSWPIAFETSFAGREIVLTIAQEGEEKGKDKRTIVRFQNPQNSAGAGEEGANDKRTIVRFQTPPNLDEILRNLLNDHGLRLFGRSPDMYLWRVVSAKLENAPIEQYQEALEALDERRNYKGKFGIFARIAEDCARDTAAWRRRKDEELLAARKRELAAAEEARQAAAEHRTWLTGMLKNPKCSPEDRAFAERFLRELDGEEPRIEPQREGRTA